MTRYKKTISNDYGGIVCRGGWLSGKNDVWTTNDEFCYVYNKNPNSHWKDYLSNVDSYSIGTNAQNTDSVKILPGKIGVHNMIKAGGVNNHNDWNVFSGQYGGSMINPVALTKPVDAEKNRMRQVAWAPDYG